MKDEITRILRLVSEGKLSPEDASELIDAFQDKKPSEEDSTQAATGESGEGTHENGGSNPPPPPGSKDPFKGFVDFLEGVERDITTNVDWKNIASQIRHGAQKGVDVIKKAAEDVKAGNLNLFYASENREVTLPLQISEGKVLKIENPSGSVTVTTGTTAEGKLTAKAKIRGNTVEEAKERAEAFSVMIEESDHHIQVRQPRQTAILVDFLVELPFGCPVDVRTESGDLHISGTGKNVKGSTQSGDIHVKGAAGLIELSIQSGDTHVEDCTPTALTFECKSGTVKLTNVNGNVNGRAASGDISIKGWSGKTLAVESVSGNVNAEIIEGISGQVTIRTVNGNTDLTLSDGNDCRVSLSTIRGDVHCNIPLDDEAKSEQIVNGRLGNGTGSLEVSGINGNINVQLIAAEPTVTPSSEAAEEASSEETN